MSASPQVDTPWDGMQPACRVPSGGIRGHSAAGRGWLYGVAVRAAREARAVSARRRARELPVASVPDRPADAADPPDPDALRALDEEVAALPEHLRTAVVLCELDGIGRSAAAGRLGIPEG